MSEAKVKEITLYLEGGQVECIPGAAITEMVALPSGLPMITWKVKGGLRRMGGFPFAVDLEEPGAIQVAGALPRGLVRQ